jgi:hypothetical protein
VTLENWRDLAVVFLALQAFVLGLIPAALLYAVVYGLTWVLRRLRALAPKVQGYFRKAAHVADQASGRVAAPIIAISSVAAQVGRYFSFPSSRVKSEV